jgi:DNA-binding transcriptional regulator YdaS (Cro superfamily)
MVAKNTAQGALGMRELRPELIWQHVNSHLQ